MGSWARRARAPKELQFGEIFGARARAVRPGPLSPRGPLSKETVFILSGMSSGILSDMLSGVLSGISSGILSGR